MYFCDAIETNAADIMFYDVADRLTNVITLSCGNDENCRGLEQQKDLQKIPVLQIVPNFPLDVFHP